MQIDHTDISGMGKRVGKDSLTLRKLKGRMTKVIRFLYVNRSLENLFSKRPIYIQIRALALAFQLAWAQRRAERDVGTK